MIRASIISRAVGEANQAKHSHQVGAVIFNKRYIISSGRNYPCKSVKHLKPIYSRWKGSVHAEVDAVIKARRDVRGCSMLVLRLVSTGFGMAKPCSQCYSFLEHIGIRTIFFSNEKGDIVKDGIVHKM